MHYFTFRNFEAEDESNDQFISILFQPGSLLIFYSSLRSHVTCHVIWHLSKLHIYGLVKRQGDLSCAVSPYMGMKSSTAMWADCQIMIKHRLYQVAECYWSNKITTEHYSYSHIDDNMTVLLCVTSLECSLLSNHSSLSANNRNR